MTALSLLGWISLGIALQVAIWLAIVYRRHHRDYLALHASHSTPKAASPAGPSVPPTDKDNRAAWSGLRTFVVKQKVVEDAEQTVCSFHLVPEDGKPLPPFLPGQFLTFQLDIPGAAKTVRCYSLSDAPRADAYRVSIKRVPAPASQNVPPGRSSNYFHDRVVVGSRLQVRAPSGHFHLDRGDAPVVLIGGGIGITPMLSMANWALTEQPGREVWLFYGVRHGGEAVMLPHLEALAAAHPNFRLRICFSAPRAGDLDGSDRRLAGRVGVELLSKQLAFKPYEFYLCGPGPLMETLVPALEDWGVPEARLHYEAFGPASIKRKAATAAAVDGTASRLSVDFASTGKQLDWKPADGSLLEFAEAHGISLNSGCRSGGCGTCQTKIKRGEVAYQQAPDFDPEPGTCLPCVCTPKTDLVLEA